MNGWKIQAAFEPPPTHATTAPSFSRHCARHSRPIMLWKSRTIIGNGCGPTTEPMM
jgi:hypothetical protein